MNLNGKEPFAYDRLMPFLVRDILVVASAYDSFLFEEEGKFSDRLLARYRELDLSSSPQIDHVTSGRAALGQLRRRSYDLVLLTPHIRDMTPSELGTEIGRRHEGLPVVLLTFDRSDPQFMPHERPLSGVDRVFLWTGDPRLFLALVKSVEDVKNAPLDTASGSVRVILVVEDSPAFYSSYLPILYSELLEQVASLLADRLNERERHYRMRARPKILLARTWGEGKSILRRYRDSLLGLVCDVRFPRGGRLDPSAGIDFIREVRHAVPDLPVLLQSSEPEHSELARELGVSFADKNSRELLAELRTFMRDHFGFGPFVFRIPGGEVVARAEGIRQMVEVLETVPAESLLYHARRNHFSIWLMARSEFELARDLRPRRVADFRDAEAMRRFLIDVLSAFIKERQRGLVAEFARSSFPVKRDFTRIGSGSMGGKGRGLAFVARLLASHPFEERFPGVRVVVPRAAVICTDVFDRFCRRDGLWERALAADDDAEVARLFLAHPLDDELLEDLAALLDEARYPLAVRSSSLLEDSEFQPLAGLYKTFLLPNSSPSDSVRLEQLSRAVRLIYASTFFQGPRTYMAATSQRLEEEKMAVVIQRLVGRSRNGRFYPDFAGVAQSHNYYPMRYLEPEDGIAAVALGLGETVVSGGRALRFSPAHPELSLQMSTPREALRTSQRHFYALDLGDPEAEIGSDEATTLVRCDLDAAESDGTLEAVGATYSADNDAIYDSIYRRGVRLVNFAGVLKHGRFPLAPVLDDLLEIGREGMGTPVEMEFAALLEDGDEPAELSVLQLRPLVAEGRAYEVELDAPGRTVVAAGPALGNGIIEGLTDVVYVHPDRLGDLSESRALAQQIARVNVRLAREHRPYLLMGPGRWGTADPWLGIPVEWKEVSGARVIVELTPEGSAIEASQGTHFFHNITSLRIGYFCIGIGREDETVDLDWLEKLPAVQESGPIRHVVTPHPLEVRIDGRSGRGVVLR